MAIIIMLTIGVLYIFNRKSFNRFVIHQIKNTLYSNSNYENFNTEIKKDNQDIKSYNSTSEYKSNSYYESN
jgi:hypothetical protein